MKGTGGAKVQEKAINDRLGRSKMITKEGKEQKAIVEGDTKRKPSTLQHDNPVSTMCPVS